MTRFHHTDFSEKEKTDSLLATVPQDIYSQAIRGEQMKEVDLLIDHYAKLILAQGEDYAELVVGAYDTKESYLSFQQKLKRAEENVTQAARRTLGAQADSEMVARIRTATEQLRRAEVERIFS